MATLVATFQTQYRLTTRAIPAGGGSVLPASGTYFDAGTSVNVNATATAPYVFTSWGGDAISTANPLSLAITAPMSIISNFGVPGFSCDINSDTHVDVLDVAA